MTDDRRKRIEEASQSILDLRAVLGDGRAGFLPVKQKGCPSASLADLYDGQSMPLELQKAHTELDRAVEKCYRPEPFHSDRERVEFLFSRYEKLTAPLLPVTPKSKGRRSQTAATEPKTGRAKTPGLYSQKPPPLPPGKSTPESQALAAHFYSAKEEAPQKTEIEQPSG